MNATPGPWAWINRPNGYWYLGTLGQGMLVVMDFARKGMNGAQPRFAKWNGEDRARQGGVMTKADAVEPDQHPDARLIAAAPTLRDALEKLVQEIEEIVDLLGEYNPIDIDLAPYRAALALCEEKGKAK